MNQLSIFNYTLIAKNNNSQKMILDSEAFVINKT